MPLPVLTGTRVARVRAIPMTAVASVRSPFTGTVQVQDWGGEWWMYELEVGPFTDAAAGKAMAAFLTVLRGPASRFLFEDPSLRNPVVQGAPVVDGAGQSGRSLLTEGWTPNAVVLGAGQGLSLGADETTRLHIATADVQADAAGRAAIPIWPALREAPADGASIEIAYPKVQLRLTAPVPREVVSGARYSFTISAEESL